MLPERAFQPRGPFGMTLEGGAADFVGDIFEGAVNVVEDVVDFTGDVVGGAVDIVQDIGRDVDDFVNEEIPGGWVTVAAVAGLTMGAPLPPGSETAAAGSAGAGTAMGTAGAAEALALESAIYGGSQVAAAPIVAAPAAFVPSAFETAVATAPTSAPTISLGPTTELGSFGSTGTAGFGTALPPASEITAGLIGAGVSPGTAANIAGETAAGVGPTNLLGGATAAAPISAPPSISISDALRGARMVNSLLTPEQQQMPQQQIGNIPQGSVDYNSLLGLLNQRASASGLLGTRFQPQSINLASLLG
jgi:hypothetical protein